MRNIFWKRVCMIEWAEIIKELLPKEVFILPYTKRLYKKWSIIVKL